MSDPTPSTSTSTSTSTNTSSEPDTTTSTSTSHEHEHQHDNEQPHETTVEELFEKSTEKALAAKVQGNLFFAKQEFTQAISSYTEALLLCPDDDITNKAIYLSNRAACHLLLLDYPSTITDCTESLTLTPRNVKALRRRAQAYEATDQLQEALDDMKVVCELEPSASDYIAATARMQQRVTDKQEKQKEEMLGKLKELGNGLLGKFGLSLDNFKATKDPNTGSYSINFNQGAPK